MLTDAMLSKTDEENAVADINAITTAAKIPRIVT